MGPSAPNSQVPRRLVECQSWRLDGHVLAAVLDRCRDPDLDPRHSEAARRLLRTAFDRLVWKFATGDRALWPDDHLTTDLWLTLDALVSALRYNSIPCHDVEKWVASRLYLAIPHDRRCRHAYRWAKDEIPGLLVRVPQTTLKRWKKMEKPMPRRLGSIDAQGHYVSARDGKHHYVADRADDPDLVADVRNAVAKSGKLAKAILATITEGDDDRVTDRGIALDLGKTRYEVGVVLGEIGARLPGYDKERQRNGN
jgi:hypothetical protein